MLLFLLTVAPFVLLLAAWTHSSERSYYVAGFTPSGAVQGLATHRGRLIVAFSNLRFGRERGLTALSDGVVPQEFDDTYDLVYEGSSVKRERWGFGYVEESVPTDPGGAPIANPKGGMSGYKTPPAPGVSHLSLVAPLWLVVCAFAMPPLRIAIRGLRRWRRWRGGQCLRCGYDLRGSECRCPECGTPFGEAQE
jgi:hypothetical protein